MEDETMEPFAQLVSLTDLDSPAIIVNKSPFVIGRHPDCDIPLVGNKYVSRTHCCITNDGDGILLKDEGSSNGTLLNKEVKLSGYEIEADFLKHGDEFYVVYKKHFPAFNVGFVYQELKQLKKEEEEAKIEEEESDVNIGDATLVDDDLNLVASPDPNLKRPKSEEAEEPPYKRTKKTETKEVERVKSETKDVKSETKDVKSETKDVKSEAEDVKSEAKNGKSETKDVKSEAKDVKSETKDVKSETKDVKSETKDVKSEAKDVKSETKNDALAETLQCLICQEILYDCISLQPCMHSFCSGCYSDWMKRSKICPTCRSDVQRINKNHMVQNLVEAYLKDHPDKKRPAEDIKELDDKNTITRDMLYPNNTVTSDSESPDETDDYGSDSEPEYEPSVQTYPGGLGAHQVWGFGTTMRPAKTVCRQCPEYKESCGAGPATCGTDGTKTMPCPPMFVCRPNQNHLLCICCLQPMPDRRIEMQTNPNIPPQQCSLCKSGFCHAYWGCRKANCDGCLAKFKDLNFGKKCLDNLVLDNFAESQILMNYLESKNINIKDLLKICLEKKESGVYDGRATYAEVNLNSNSVLCYACGLRNFKELVYQYRCDIPKEDLPDEVNKKPNCYWGKNCRTQKNKPYHATRYNHICEQTRTT